MKYCTNCGTKLNDEDRFCTNCGNKMPVVEPVNPAPAAVEPVAAPVTEEPAPVVEPAQEVKAEPVPVVVPVIEVAEEVKEVVNEAPAPEVVEEAKEVLNEIPAEDIVKPVVEENVAAAEPAVQVEKHAEDDILNAALAMEKGQTPASQAPAAAVPVFGAVDYNSSASQPYGTANNNAASYQTYNQADNAATSGAYGAVNYGTPVNPAPVADDGNKKPLVSMILGIAGLVTSETGLLGLGLGIAALLLSKSGKNSQVKKNQVFGKLGKIFGIVSIIIGALSFVTVAAILAFYLVTTYIVKPVDKPYGNIDVPATTEVIIDDGYTVAPDDGYATIEDIIEQIQVSKEDSISELYSAWTEIDKIPSKELGNHYDEIADFFNNSLYRAEDYAQFLRNMQAEGFKVIAPTIDTDEDWIDSVFDLTDAVDDAFYDYFDAFFEVAGLYFDKIDEAFDTVEFDVYEKLYDYYDIAWDVADTIYSESWDNIYADYEAVIDGFEEGETDVEKILANANK